MTQETTIRSDAALLAEQPPIFSPIEWRAVLVALRDAERPSRAVREARGRAERAWSWLTGRRTPRPLADPRLEAIRRFVWAARRRGARAMEMVPELRRLGLSSAQVDVLARIAA